MPCKECESWEKCFKDYHELFNDPMIQKAIQYAYNNPILVYGEGSEEYDRFLHGYFDLYRSTIESCSAVERQ